MRLRTIGGIVLYLVAILAPVGWLYNMYGLSSFADVNGQDATAALVGTMVVAFVLGLCAARVSQPRRSSQVDALTKIVRRVYMETTGVQDSTGRGRSPAADPPR